MTFFFLQLLALLCGLAGEPLFGGHPGRAQSPAIPTLPAMRLYVLDGGSIEFHAGGSAAMQLGATREETRSLANPCFLVVHPKGTLLWDTGWPDELAASPQGRRGPIATIRLSRPLATQLTEIGHPPATIGMIAISHRHPDHVGNVDLFPQALLLKQRSEPFAPTGDRNRPMRNLDGDHDVFGDGTVVIKAAPGHTLGHQILFLKLAATGNIVLSGDLAHSLENWRSKTPMFSTDDALAIKSMHDVEVFLRANQASLWIQHDPVQNATLRRAPAFYD